MGGYGCQNPTGDDPWDYVMEVQAALADGRQSKFVFCATLVA